MTIVLSNPSRHDLASKQLLSANGGTFFEYYCLQSTDRRSCDIRTADTIDAGLLSSTKCILLLGEGAFQKWTDGYKEYSLNEQRGCPLLSVFKDSGVTTIASYSAQDSVDLTSNHEKKHNPLLIANAALEDDSDDDDSDADVKMRHGKTKRRNWTFWLQRDTQKIISALGGVRKSGAEYKNKVYPTVKEIDELSRSTFNQFLYEDIETITETDALDISVFSFAIGNGIIYTIPIIRWNYQFAYSDTDMCILFRALARLRINNIPVLHNAMFDLFVLAHRFKIPVGPKVEDTMLCWHRCFPEADKSLGHVMSTLTWEPYHKSDGIFNPKSVGQEQQLWRYNAHDVHGTRLIHQALMLETQRRPGLANSMAQANSMIRPYLINTLFGMRFDNARRQEMISLNDRWMMQYLRCITLLVGEETMHNVKSKASKSTLPASSRQCVKYFHDIMSYPIVGVSKITGKPSLDEKNFYKLALKMKDKGIVNPVVDLVLAYRSKAKETGSLKFNHWVDGLRNTTSWMLAGTDTFRLASRKLLK